MKYMLGWIVGRGEKITLYAGDGGEKIGCYS